MCTLKKKCFYLDRTGLCGGSPISSPLLLLRYSAPQTGALHGPLADLSTERAAGGGGGGERALTEGRHPLKRRCGEPTRGTHGHPKGVVHRAAGQSGGVQGEASLGRTREENHYCVVVLWNDAGVSTGSCLKDPHVTESSHVLGQLFSPCFIFSQCWTYKVNELKSYNICRVCGTKYSLDCV